MVSIHNYVHTLITAQWSPETIYQTGVNPNTQKSRGNQTGLCQMIAKPLIIAILFVMAAGITYAQDIIVTTKSEKITAKITEVDVEVIRYKQFDYQDGPIYTIKKSEIASIIYENGSVMTFEQARETPPPAPTTSKSEDKNTDYLYFKSLARNDGAMYSFLKTRDNECYQMFHRGIQMSRAGKGILVPGILLTVAGVVLIGVAYAESYEDAWGYYGPDEDLLLAGTILTPIGGAFVITSIPLSASGGKLKSRAKNLYEQKYFQGQTAIKPSLQLNSNSNGIGLCLKF